MDDNYEKTDTISKDFDVWFLGFAGLVQERFLCGLKQGN